MPEAGRPASIEFPDMATQTLTRDELQLLRALPVFAGISERELAEVAAAVRRRSYRRGELIHRADDLAGDVFIVTHGHVKHRLMAFDGRQLTHAVVSTGSSFGLMSVIDQRRRAADAVALTDCEVMVLDRETYRAYLARHPEANGILLDSHVRMLRGSLSLIHDLAFLNVPARLAKVLLRFAQPEPGSEALVIPSYLNQAELAFLVGTSRESVNQWLKRFSRQGWVALDRRSLRIIDSEALRASIA